MTRSKIGILFIGILLIITIIATILHNPKGPGENISGTSNNILAPSISLKVFMKSENSWGYEVFIDSTRLIYQDVIPCVSGVHHFKSQEEASKCGELVLQKIKSNINPALSLAEIDSLGIDY